MREKKNLQGLFIIICFVCFSYLLIRRTNEDKRSWRGCSGVYEMMAMLGVMRDENGTTGNYSEIEYYLIKFNCLKFSSY